jgi:hypothetical protein
VNVKVYVVSTAEGLLKLNSNTAGLPSVAEAETIVYSWTPSLSLIVPVAEAVPETIVKVSLDSAIVSAVVGTRNSSRSSTRRYSYCLRSGSVISTSSSSIGECKECVVSSAEGFAQEIQTQQDFFSSRSRSDCGYSWSRIIIIDCSSSEAVPEAIVKVSLDSAIVSAVVGTNSSRSSTRRYSLLFAKW